MYFVLSKVGWLLLQPSTLLFAATLIGALLVTTPLARFGRRLALIAGSLLAICALTPLCVVLLRPLENRFPARSLDAIANPTGIIALGGAFNAEVTRARGPIALSTSGSRVTEAAALALRFPKARLVFTGGSANLIGKGIAEGDVAEDFFSELDVPKDQVTIERTLALAPLGTKSTISTGHARPHVSREDHRPASQRMIARVSTPVISSASDRIAAVRPRK